MTRRRPAPRETPTTSHPAPTLEGKAMTDLPTAPDSVRRIGRPAHRSWSKVALTGGLALAIGLLAACGTSSAGSAVAAPNESAAAPSSGQPNPSGQANPSGQGGPGRTERDGGCALVRSGEPDGGGGSGRAGRCRAGGQVGRVRDHRRRVARHHPGAGHQQPDDGQLHGFDDDHRQRGRRPVRGDGRQLHHRGGHPGRRGRRGMVRRRGALHPRRPRLHPPLRRPMRRSPRRSCSCVTP